jgi:hypothetical protein
MLSLSLYCLVLIVTVSYVPNVLCVSVFSIIDCHCFLCAQCCLCLCIVYYWLSLFPVCPMLCVSLIVYYWLSLFPVCPMLCVSLIVYYWLSLFPVFSMLSMSLYSLLLIVTVSCVPNVVCVSVLSIIDCHCFLCAQCCLCLCIIIGNTETQTTLGTQETVTINNRQYRDTDNIGHTGNSDNQ